MLATPCGIKKGKELYLAKNAVNRERGCLKLWAYINGSVKDVFSLFLLFHFALARCRWHISILGDI